MAGQIFSGNINALATSWMMIYMLLFAVAWEAWCGFLIDRAGDNRAQQEMLSKVGKELMILGFIAFGVILLKEFNVFVWNGATLLTFEFCDLLISICVLICASGAPLSRPIAALRARAPSARARLTRSRASRAQTSPTASSPPSPWRRLSAAGTAWR